MSLRKTGQRLVTGDSDRFYIHLLFSCGLWNDDFCIFLTVCLPNKLHCLYLFPTFKQY